ncbi:hypothetical protein BG005_000400 [Podila minutissima]|nr:hypothetical protein BG005_000400 [Podila minutissima]
MDENESMMYGGQVPKANVMDTGDNVAIDAQYEAGVRPQATEELDGIMSLESEVRGLIDSRALAFAIILGG